MTALMYEQPVDPVEFLENRLTLVRTTNMTDLTGPHSID